MEVILREDIIHLGTTGDIVKVKPGYARNYLLPRGLAVMADRRNVGELEHHKRLAGRKRDQDRLQAQSVADKVAALNLSFTAKAGEEGKLFGSITNLDIEAQLSEQGISIDRRRIRIDEPIKSIGDHKVKVHLSGGVVADLALNVAAEGASAGDGGESAAAGAGDG